MCEAEKIMRCTKEDVADIVSISCDLSKDGLVNALSVEELQEAVASKGYYVVVVKDDEQVVGFSVSSYSWGKLHIEEVGVRRDVQRKGIGKKLITHLVKHAKKKKLPEVYCEVKEKNIPSLKLFLNAGFKQRVFVPLGDGAFYGLYLPLD